MKLINLLFLGHNFEPETLDSSSKAQKTWIPSPVSNKHLSQKIASRGLGQGSDDLSPNGQKPIPLMTSPTKNLKPKT